MLCKCAFRKFKVVAQMLTYVSHSKESYKTMEVYRNSLPLAELASLNLNSETEQTIHGLLNRKNFETSMRRH